MNPRYSHHSLRNAPFSSQDTRASDDAYALKVKALDRWENEGGRIRPSVATSGGGHSQDKSLR